MAVIFSIYSEWIKKNFLENEWARVCFLSLLVIYAYHSFFSDLNIGAMDARWYQYSLHDAILQWQHHFFPPIVGQSEFNYMGASYLRAPYYLLFGVLIHILTFGLLDSLYVQHLTIIVSALMAALLFYFFLIKLVPHSRWYALFTAFFYITCPAIMSLIYKMDMYFSFMTLPFIPIVIYGLIRVNQKGDTTAYLLIALGLSLLWMAHPPIGLWTLIISVLFLFVQYWLGRKDLLKLLIIPFLFVLLNLWQFIGIFSLGLGDYYSTESKSNFLRSVMAILKADLPGAFLPLGWKITGTPFLQLGYSLWIIFFLGMIIALCSRRHFLARNLLLSSVFLITLLFAIPGLTYWLWWLLPSRFYSLTAFPMQRLYPLLAALSCFIGMLTFSVFWETSQNLKKYFFPALFFMLFCWNIYEIHYFFRGAMIGTSNSWGNSRNLLQIPYGVLPVHNTNLLFNLFDPVLKNNLLDQQQMPIKNFDNQEVLSKRCVESFFTFPGGIFPNHLNPVFPLHIRGDSEMTFLKFNGFSKKNLLLCFEIFTDNVGLFTEFIDHSASLIGDFLFFPQQTPGLSRKIVSIPFLFPSQKKTMDSGQWQLLLKGVELGFHKASPIDIKSMGIIEYEKDQLPIRITSFTPYKAEVYTTSSNTYLSMGKEFFPGYIAKVDGKLTPVVASTANKMVIIPLQSQGKHYIELLFLGTSLLRFSFLVSAITWCLLISYLFRPMIKRYLTMPFKKYKPINYLKGKNHAH